MDLSRDIVGAAYVFTMFELRCVVFPTLPDDLGSCLPFAGIFDNETRGDVRGCKVLPPRSGKVLERVCRTVPPEHA